VRKKSASAARLGPEYDGVDVSRVRETGETILREREKSAFPVAHTFASAFEKREQFAASWRLYSERFVDDPHAAWAGRYLIRRAAQGAAVHGRRREQPSRLRLVCRVRAL